MTLDFLSPRYLIGKVPYFLNIFKFLGQVFGAPPISFSNDTPFMSNNQKLLTLVLAWKAEACRGHQGRWKAGIRVLEEGRQGQQDRPTGFS